MPPYHNPKWDYSSCIFFRQYKKYVQTSPNDVISLFYYDIQSITEEVYQGFRIGRKPAVIHITRKDNIHYYLYSYSTDNNETRNMLLTIQNALNNSGQ